MDGRVQNMGYSAYITKLNEAKKLPSIAFEAKHAYVRWFLCNAIEPGKKLTDSDAVPITNQYPSRVLIGEMLGNPVFNEVDAENTKDGFIVPDGYFCLEIIEGIVKSILDMELPYGMTFERPLTEEEATNFLGYLKTYYSETRAEISKQDIDQFKATLKGWVETSYYDTVYKALQAIVSDFSLKRTDIITWVSPIQVTNINGKFRRGSLPPFEEDEGKQRQQSWLIGNCIQEFLFNQWKNTKEAEAFTDKDSEEAIKKFREWMNDRDNNRCPWQLPSNGLVHFCISAECEPNKEGLKLNEAKQVDYTFGYYQGGHSAKKNNGKSDKIKNAMTLGRVNADPDFVFVYMGYTSSEDKGDASNAMSPQDIWFDAANPNATLAAHVGVDATTIHKAHDIIIADKKHTKVRLYDNFPFEDQLLSIRDWFIEHKVAEGVNVNDHRECLIDILGVIAPEQKTNMSSIIGSTFGTPAPQATTEAQQVTAPAPQETTAPAQQATPPAPQATTAPVQQATAPPVAGGLENAINMAGGLPQPTGVPAQANAQTLPTPDNIPVQ